MGWRRQRRERDCRVLFEQPDKASYKPKASPRATGRPRKNRSGLRVLGVQEWDLCLACCSRCLAGWWELMGSMSPWIARLLRRRNQAARASKQARHALSTTRQPSNTTRPDNVHHPLPPSLPPRQSNNCRRGAGRRRSSIRTPGRNRRRRRLYSSTSRARCGSSTHGRAQETIGRLTNLSWAFMFIACKASHQVPPSCACNQDFEPLSPAIITPRQQDSYVRCVTGYRIHAPFNFLSLGSSTSHYSLLICLPKTAITWPLRRHQQTARKPEIQSSILAATCVPPAAGYTAGQRNGSGVYATRFDARQ